MKDSRNRSVLSLALFLLVIASVLLVVIAPAVAGDIDGISGYKIKIQEPDDYIPPGDNGLSNANGVLGAARPSPAAVITAENKGPARFTRLLQALLQILTGNPWMEPLASDADAD